MKKVLAVLLAGFILILPGCSLVFPESESTSSGPVSSQSSASYSKEYESNWCYQRLDTRLKSCYAEVYAAVREGFDKDDKVTIADSEKGTKKEYTGIKITLSQPLHSREEAQELYTAFTTDNPQLFYIGNLYSYEGYRSGSVDYYNVFDLVYSMDAQQRAEASKQLNSAIAPVLQDAQNKAGGSQFKLELLLHDRLLAMCTYETGANNTDSPLDSYPTAFTAYGALVQGRAVCEGYSRAMQLLLRRSGIECTLVNGFDDQKVAHMWNLVTIDGKNYHLDPTWDDTNDLIQHTYFNLTTDEITRSHKLDTDNIGIDTCTAQDANYYRCSGLYFDTSKRDDIAKVIADKVRSGDTSVDMQFSKSAFASAHLFINNSQLLSEKVNAFLKPYHMEMWSYDGYNINETYYTIMIYKS